jgi:hypothetical protein
MQPVRRVFRATVEAWRTSRVSEAAIGRYVILFASLLHIGWAVLLIINPTAGSSTPVAIILRVFGGPYRSAAVLVACAVVAMIFPFKKHRVSAEAMAGLLIPQQVLLFMSAGAGVYAAATQRYSDGVVRGHEFILADQLPVILLALLYSVVILEAAFEPVEPS